MKKGRLHIIADPLYGDSGKGKIATIYCISNKVKCCVEFGTGDLAEHTINIGKNSYSTHIIPPTFLNEKCQLVVSESIQINKNLLQQDMKSLVMFDVAQRLVIDSNCKVCDISDATKDLEIKTAISDGHLKQYCRNTKELIAQYVYSGEDVIMILQHGAKVTKGYGEGEVVSKPVSVWEVLKMYQDLKDFVYVTFVLKLMPTRSLNGPLPFEIEWPEYLEPTVGKVTGIQHRISLHIDDYFLKELSQLNLNFNIAVTFADYYDNEMKGRQCIDEITPKLRKELDRIETLTKHKIDIISTGSDLGEYIWYL